MFVFESVFESVCARVLAGGPHVFVIVLNCVSVRYVFVVTHMWLSHLFLHPRLLLHHTSPPVSFSLQCALCSHLWILTVDWCYCGQAHHVRYQFTPSESIRLREQVHSFSGGSVRGHVEIWSRAHVCNSVILCGRKGLASDTDLRAV